MSDQISRLVCQLLNENSTNWIWAAYPNNNRPWVRIFRTNWLDYVVAGDLINATRNGRAIDGEYPIIWFELTSSRKLRIQVPLGTKGFRRPATCDSYNNFLHSLIDNNHNRWQGIVDGCNRYLNHNEIARLKIDRQVVDGQTNDQKATFTRNYIVDRFPVIDDAFANL